MKPLSRLLHYAQADRGWMALASLCSVTNKVFDIAPEILIGIAVDVVVSRQNSLLARWGLADLNQQLLALGLATFLIWLLESLFEYLHQVLWRNLAQRIQHQLRMDCYRHLQGSPYPELEKHSTGSLLALLNEDVNQLERFLDGGANSILQVITSVILVGATFLYLSPTVAVLAFLPIPLVLGGAFAFQRRLQPRYLQVRQQAAQVHARLSLNLQGMMNIQSYGSEDFEAQRVERESLRYLHCNRQAIALSSAFTPVLRLAILAGFLCTLLVGGHQCLQGQLSAGSYSVLVFLTQRLLWPLTGLAATSDLYQRAMASVGRLLDLLDWPILDLKAGQEAQPPQRCLRLQGLHFGYPGREPILRGLNLEIPAGQFTAIVGPTGSGKSTLIKLLLRFLEPQQGQIWLDDQLFSSLSIASLRRCFALVSQDVFLNDDTVRDNIAYAKSEVDEAKLWQAAELAGAQDWIHSLPQGMVTPLGERASQLSGGQRQRLAIARAFYRQAPILVLDEATSAIDNETEAALAQSLSRWRQSSQQTLVVIAHRLASVRQADCIHVLDQGRLVESGRHQELLQLDGHYARLWKLQSTP